MDGQMLFNSFFLAGFECSSQRLRSGKRLDLIHSTRHDELAARDYSRVRDLDLRTVRDGIRWHLIETSPYQYDFSSALSMIRAARDAGVQVIWDLFHYGWPDDLDILSPEFVTRFAKLSRAFTQLLKNETNGPLFISPVNEPSFVSWAGGDAGFMNPFATGRDWDIKAQLIRAAIEATEAVWDVAPTARIVQCEPAIHIVPDVNRMHESDAVEKHRQFQFQALDMLTGRAAPELGGRPKYLDILGMNFYYNNEWIHNGGAIYTFSPQYRLLHTIIAEFYERYKRPIFLAETGIEDDSRASWLAYICSEVRWAMNAGIPFEGICLYPILNHPGWMDDRHCQNGLFDYADAFGNRGIYQPLAEELKFQQLRFPKLKAAVSDMSGVTT